MNDAHKEYRSIEELIINEENPRGIRDSDFSRLKKQIQKLGMYKPVLIDTRNKVLGGNMRVRAYRDLGIKDVWVSVVDPKSKTEEMEYILSDNDRAGFWEEDDLAEILSHLPDLELTGYSIDVGMPKDLKIFLQDYGPDTVVEDELPAVSEEEPNSSVGRVYQLGRHRLMCGDATKIEDVEMLMGGEKADMVFTDPPYGVDYRSQAGNSYNAGKFAHLGKIFNDDKTSEENLEFFRDTLANLYVASKDKCVIYWWLAFNSNAMENLVAFKQTGWKMSQQITWVKDRFVFSRGQDFHRISEPCFFGWKEGKTHFSNKRINNLADCFTMDYDSFQMMPDVWFENRDKTSEYLHPTQKPVRLAARAIKKSSVHGDIVLDVFGGSGSSMSACEQLGRRSFTMELDPYYADVIRKRYHILTTGAELGWEDATPEINEITK